MREQIKIPVELCRPDANLPAYAHSDDAGMDIYAAEDTEIAPLSTGLVPTGLKVAIPDGFELQIRPRSGLSLKTSLRVPNSPGTIDAGYRDEVKVIVWNASPTEAVTVKKGDRIAQFVLARVPMACFALTDDISSFGAGRGGGFGSSGISETLQENVPDPTGSLSGSHSGAHLPAASVPEAAIGQDSHAFLAEFDPEKPLILGGVRFDERLSLRANSDGDVLLHALTNAVSGLTGRNILGRPADRLCAAGFSDSSEYLKLALSDLDASGKVLTRISFTVEAARPRFAGYIDRIREKVAALTGLTPEKIGITATSGEALTGAGRGEGIQVFCLVSACSRCAR